MTIAPHDSEAETRTPRRRILVAEDNPANQAVLRMQLDNLGFDADIAFDGVVALSKWQLGGHDLILADYKMPNMGGKELAGAIRAIEKAQSGTHIPIIAITAAHHSEAAVHYLDSGMDDVLQKPIALDDLRNLLMRWLPDAIQVESATASPRSASFSSDVHEVLDMDQLARLVGRANTRQACELIELFVSTVRRDMAACRQHLSSHDSHSLALLMHKHKSSAHMVGAMHFAALAVAIEKAAKAKQLAVAGALMDELDIALDSVVAAVGEIGSSRSRNSDTGVAGGRIGQAACPGDSGISPADIIDGIHNNEFEVYFQPIVNAATLRAVGVEALARWTRNGVPISPDVFIDVAKKHDLIGQLSELLITKAMLGGVRLADSGFTLPVAVNVSVNCLSDIRFPEFVKSTVLATGFNSEILILEISESDASTNDESVLKAIARLRQQGCRLSIDDFGSGCSTMEQLQNLSLAEIKFDCNIVHQAAEDAEASAHLSSCIETARLHKLTAVAECVETQAEFDLVRSMGCDLLQGWFMAKAMPLDRLIPWLQCGQVR